MLWLLIVCAGFGSSGGGQYCRDHGGMAMAMVTEAQCRAMLEQSGYATYTYVRCVSPTGEVFHGKWR